MTAFLCFCELLGSKPVQQECANEMRITWHAGCAGHCRPERSLLLGLSEGKDVLLSSAQPSLAWAGLSMHGYPSSPGGQRLEGEPVLYVKRSDEACAECKKRWRCILHASMLTASARGLLTR